MSIDGSASLAVSLDGLGRRIDGLSSRLDRDAIFIARANEAFRQVPFIISVPLVSGAGTLNPASAGPDIGYIWSIRKLCGVGWTAGTVNLYIDNTNGEPIVPFPQTGVFTFGKGEQILNEGSSVAVSATGITGTVQLWGKADQFERWLWPWYMGANRDTH